MSDIPIAAYEFGAFLANVRERLLLRDGQDVEILGSEESRKISGYHDEPLHGDRRGQRSIRLSRSYRAIYIVKDGVAEFVLV